MKTSLLLTFLIASLFIVGNNQTQASSTSSLVFENTPVEIKKSKQAPIEELLLVTFIIGGILGYREFKS